MTVGASKGLDTVDRRKTHGVHYTPRDLAEFFAEVALQAFRSNALKAVLDPAAGGGELLEAVWKGLSGRQREAVRLVGLDDDPEAIATCRERLGAVTTMGLELVQADFLRVSSVPEGEPCLIDDPSTHAPDALHQPFDLAIANPPYVRTQRLGRERVQALARKYRLQGRVDLYQAFAFAMHAHLKHGGVLALLCSNRFLSTRAGESLRELFRREYEIDRVVDLGDTRLFEAAVLPVIVVARKNEETRPFESRFVSIYESRNAMVASRVPRFKSVTEALRSDHAGLMQIDNTPTRYRVRRGTLEMGSSSKAPWALRDEATTDFLERAARHTKLRFADVGRVRVGIKTTADSVFIRDDWDRLPWAVQPEPALLRPLLTHECAGRWNAAQPTKRVLYPHLDLDGRCRPVNLSEFPRAKAYLESHRRRLSSRKYVLDAGRQWFEVWVPQRPREWASPKVVFPDIAEDPQFFLDRSGAIVNGDCYWITVPDDAIALLLLAVGNSTFTTRYYDAVSRNQLYAGRRRFMTQYVKDFPLPDPESAVSQEAIALAADLCGRESPADLGDESHLDRIVWASFGFEEAVR